MNSRNRFPTTRWSVVLTAGDRASQTSDEALAELCTIYWGPVYSYVRSRGFQQHDAEELTQEFFAKLIEKEFLTEVSSEGGRFRNFVLVCVKRFLSNDYDRRTAKKRGGEQRIFSIDRLDKNTKKRHEPIGGLTPEHEFERRWALVLLDHVLGELAEEWREAGNGELFEVLKIFLTPQQPLPSHQEIATATGMSSGAVGVAVHRLRKRYGELLRREIADTLPEGGDVEEEIQNLFSAFSL